MPSTVYCFTLTVCCVWHISLQGETLEKPLPADDSFKVGDAVGAQQMETLVFHWAATVPRINNCATRRADLLDQANRGVCGAINPGMARDEYLEQGHQAELLSHRDMINIS